MNGEVSSTMEDIRISLANLENSQEIVEIPLANSVEPEPFVKIPLVDCKNHEENLHIPVVKSVESETFALNNIVNLEKPKEIAKIHLENSQVLEEIADFEETTTIATANLENSKNITDIKQLVDLKEPEEIGKMYNIDSGESKKTVKIPFADIDDTATPLAVSEVEETVEIPFENTGRPEGISKISFIKTEDTKDVIEISLDDSEESEKIVEASLISSEDSKQSIDIDNIENEDHVIQIATTKSIDDIYSDLSQEAVINGNIEHSESNNSTDSDGIRPEVTTINFFDLVPDAELASNDVEESQHCSNSNGSFAESMTSSQTKSETTSQQPIDRLNENSNIFLKSENDSQHSEDEADLDEITDIDESEEEFKATDTVSIYSDSDTENDLLIPVNEESSQENQSKVNTHETIKEELTESTNGNSQEACSPEIYEIDSENEDGTELKEVKLERHEDPVPLRRSSRAIKRKRYTDELENVDDYEPAVEDPLRHNSRPMEVNNANFLIKMSTKNMTPKQCNNYDNITFKVFKRNTKKYAAKTGPGIAAMLYNQNIYDEQQNTNTLSSKSNTVANHTSQSPSILPNQGNKHIKNTTNAEKFAAKKAAGISAKFYNRNMHDEQQNTNILSSKSNTVTNHTSQSPSILPSLTDDMYVVEAPSFIVPYVYEKPSVVAFREFVETLGKQLQELKLNEKELEKPKGSENNDKKDKAKTEKNEESGDEEDSFKNKMKEAKKELRRPKDDDDDDASWDGESTTESEEDILSDEEDKISIIKDKEYSLDQINRTTTDLSLNKVTSTKTDSYFDCSLGNFFTVIGYNLVQEHVQNDLLKQQNRKLYREKKLGHDTLSTETSVASLKKNLELSKENNAAYALKLRKCKICTFKTESALIMAHHLETPHLKNNVYKCNFCPTEVKKPHDILIHMDTVHNIRGKLEILPACHQCANCTFEDNSKGKLARHLIPCMKKFKPELNLAPPFDWEPPAKIPKISKTRNNMVTPYQHTFIRGQTGNTMSRPMNVTSIIPSCTIPYRPRGRSPMAGPPRPVSMLHGLPIMRSTVMLRHNAPIANSSNFSVRQKSLHQPSISITPLPRQPQPVQSVQPQQANPNNTFVICEICDGYIKDLEQLRNHMQSIHKVKIHPKMIYNRPPLNCQKCQFRFFTDQGLERHLLGSHGLVTSSMQEAANKEKDAGRCPVCGRVYQWKLLNHVARDHNLTLKPAHLSYKCTVCAATFGMYKQFENHVYSAHSVVAKRVIDKRKSPSSPNKSNGNNTSSFKRMKMNDEITIVPQTVKSSKDN